ncbi:MAG: ATP-dependent DNA helicase RecG [Bryobacteraceae bacterium]|nr:MAG: ATP-dependent DNA helicase RecG [Bryobacteraceae bacterium]
MRAIGGAAFRTLKLQAPHAVPIDLSTPVMYVKGVGPKRAEELRAKGLETAADLLYYAPFRYEDRSNLKPLSRLAPGETATVIATVRRVQAPRFRRRDLGMIEAVLDDGSRIPLTARWFHAQYLANLLQPGVRVALFGKVDFDPWIGGLLMTHPELEILRGEDDEEDAALHTGRIVPVYEAAGKVSTRVFRNILYRLTSDLGGLEDPLPDSVRRRLRLPDLAQALRALHFPPSGADVNLLNQFRTPEQFRLIFEEFFWLEAGLAIKRGEERAAAGISFQLTDRVREQIKRMLPFKPTAAQKRVLGEIARDMASPVPMNRLLQGDVGSGKTIVAAQAAVIAVENGYQTAILAPTEILATQHYLNFRKIFAPLNYQILLLLGSLTKKEKEFGKRAAATGFANIVIGTHALIEEDVRFARLGLVIIDEQHRFGVLQRKALQQKGVSPDVLVMTATPIPRTLALTIYGDLDLSVIDELPPGRKPIQTLHRTRDEIEQVYSFLLKEIQAGRQAYIVYPAIEENESTALKAAEAGYRELTEHVFPELKIGLLHGRFPAEEKDRVMEAFKRGELQILVSTTVIEVGVDVPNATVMVIENAERFGLAQLHQLRGRVGRGAAQSYCILVTDRLSETARERIRTLVDSNDGFYISEMDLKLRGPGEFLGTRQSGLPVFRIGNLIRDQEILELARREAVEFAERPPSREEFERAMRYVRDHWQQRYGLALVG